MTGYEALIPGGGTMGELIRSYDWSSTAVGAIESWSPSLRTAVSIMLGSRYPMYVWWGEECLNFYNDACIPILGALHSQALGQPAAEIWSNVWDTISYQVEGVLQQGQTFLTEASMFVIERNGYSEETYFTFSFSPISREDGSVGGLIAVVTEDTRRVLSDRRIQTLRELAESTLGAQTIESAVKRAIATLGYNLHDCAFTLLYLIDETETKAKLVATTNLEEGTSVSPLEIELDAPDDLWSLDGVLRSKKSQTIQLEGSKYGHMPGGVWLEPCKLAVVLPIGTLEVISGFLIVGVSPLREFDDDYQGFFALVAGQIATAIANARAYEAQKQRAEALAEIDRAKTAFFSNVSHEFRTPLTLMLSPLEDVLADTHAPLPPVQRQRIEVIQRNGLRLLKLVNILLDFSRIEAGRVRATYQPTDLAALTTELASVFRSAIEKAGMELEVDCPPLPEAVYIDRELWEKIVFNLISNAFKFTLEGKITVRLRCLDEVELTVLDTGVGIPPDELPRLFDRFHQVKDCQGRSFEGSGIGLSLVKELVELHRGTVTVSSTLGKGSCFTVAIPTGSAHLPSDRIQANPAELKIESLDTNPYLQEALNILPNSATADIQPEVVDISSLCINSSARILLADDNADMRDYLARLLNNCYRVETVADGIAALDAVRANPPDLVLCDVMMSGINGFELLRVLRADPQTQEIPIILLSARAGEESRIEGLAAGADDYLIKPFSTKELLARIEGTLKLAELRRTTQNLRSQTKIAQASLKSVLYSLRDGFYTLDRHWNFTYANPRLLEIADLPYEAMIDRNIWELYPDVLDTEFEHQFRRAMKEKIPLQFEFYYAPWNRWFENRIYGVPDGLAVLVADISDRKYIEREREQLLVKETLARSKAEELNRLKDEFLAIVSHELRTPLNPILGWSQLLTTGRLNPEQTVEGIAVIERNAKLQAQLIDDLLDVSRILRGKIKLNKIPLNFANIIRAAIATVELTAKAKSIAIVTDFQTDAIVSADAQRLQQIVWNLLSNAIKFTPEAGQVTVKLDMTEDYACLQVIDTGRGIEPEFLPHVFDRFRQADSASTRDFGGLGLGLAIVSNLTELHDGSIAVASPGIGQGSTFSLKLPLKLAIAINDSEPSNNATPAKQLAGVKILIVDDEADSLSLLAFILEQEGAEVKTASSADRAFKALNESTFALIISDIGMPNTNGYQLMRQIRASKSPIANILAIALSAYAAESDIKQAYEAGFHAHITKPFEIKNLIAKAIELVNRSK